MRVTDEIHMAMLFEDSVKKFPNNVLMMENKMGNILGRQTKKWKS